MGNCLAIGSPNCSLNYETKEMYLIEVESMDDKTPSLKIIRSFNISVIDKNDPPYDLQLSENRVNENATVGTIIGQFTAKDEDRNPKQSLAYTLVDDDNGRFNVTNNGTFIQAKKMDYEISKMHEIEVNVTDNGSPPKSVSFSYKCTWWQN